MMGNAAAKNGKTNPSAAEKGGRGLIILIVVVIVAVIVAAVGIIGKGVTVAPSGYEEVITQYFDAIAERDFDGYTGAMLDRIAQDYVEEREELGYAEYDYMSALYSDMYEGYGDNFTIVLTFGEEAVRPDESYIDSFSEAYKELYGESISTKNVYGVTVTAQFVGDAAEESLELECYVLKSGGKWYIIGCDFADE